MASLPTATIRLKSLSEAPPVTCGTEDEKSTRSQNDNGSSDTVVELKT